MPRHRVLCYAQAKLPLPLPLRPRPLPCPERAGQAARPCIYITGGASRHRGLLCAPHPMALLTFCLLAAAAGAAVVVVAVRRVFFSPLARFPGPWLAAATGWYEFYFDGVRHGQFFREIERMHQAYGPVVRVGPHELHVRDPDWHDTLYAGGRQPRDKSAWHLGSSAGQSTFGTVPHAHHRLRRHALSPFFSKRAVAGIEPLVRARVDKLAAALARRGLDARPVELQTAFMALTLDVISHYAFGQPFGLVDTPDFAPAWKKAILASIEAGIVNRHFPWLGAVLSSLPEAMAVRVSAPAAFFVQLQRVRALSATLCIWPRLTQKCRRSAIR